MEKRYRALRTVASLLKTLGVIAGVLTILLSLGVCASITLGSSYAGAFLQQFDSSYREVDFGGLQFVFGLLASLAPLLMGGGFALTLFALGEALMVQIDVEANTRAMAYFLRDQLRQAQAVQPANAAPAPQANGADFCPYCGVKTQPGDTRCAACGQALKS